MKRALRFVAVAAAVALAAAETDLYGVDSSRLQVQIPAELFKPLGYVHQEALFGIPHYGGSIAQRLLYAGNTSTPFTLCSDAEAEAFVNPTASQPFVLLIDRGGTDCTFVSKVRRAQKMGAAAALIVDDRCLCSEMPACKSEVKCEAIEPIMADDGSGADITIPSFLMKKPDGDVLKSHLEAKEFIQIELTWSMPAPDDRVEWSLWTSTIDPAAATFKKEFKEVAVSLAKHAWFTPYYVLYDGNQYGCKNVDLKHCGNLCTNNGRYCFPDPDFDRNKGLSGADVVKETLRQKCVWMHYGGAKAPESEQGIGTKWWDYVTLFKQNCDTAKFADKACVSSALAAAKVDEALINKCMAESGGLDGDVVNTILEAEVTEKSTKSIVVTPTIYVNNVVERGGVSTPAVLSTICVGFASGTEPKVCQCVGQGTSTAVLECVANGGPSRGGRSGLSLSNVLGILFVAALAMGAVGAAYYKKTQDNMRDQVRGILAEYMPLEDLDGGASRGQPFMSGSHVANGSSVGRNGGGGGLQHGGPNGSYVGPKNVQLV